VGEMTERIPTLTLIAGTTACNNNCPICISKMTPKHGMDRYHKIDLESFHKACNIAKNFNTENVLITGKGEPTLYPWQITEYLWHLKDYNFDKVELQTEGDVIYNLEDDMLRSWKMMGLDLVALSVYHFDHHKNWQGFGREGDGRPSIEMIVENLKDIGFKVRLSCCMMRGYIDNVPKVVGLINFARDLDVMQLTLRDISRPEKPLNVQIGRNVDELRLTHKELSEIKMYVDEMGTLVRTLPHGASIYELHGQNVSMTTGLGSIDRDTIRELIYFPYGLLTTSWVHVNGGRIL
jgi:molybdenum cofactor biosynthesis enzyme MoaA